LPTLIGERFAQWSLSAVDEFSKNVSAKVATHPTGVCNKSQKHPTHKSILKQTTTIITSNEPV
jgi:hypothetical protein